MHFFASIPSTNTYAMEAGTHGARHGSVFFADEQTAGRGRSSHQWQSPAGCGVYASILLRPSISPGDALWFSLATGLAAHNAIQQVTTLRADIRWPNDLMLGRKKFGGILTEMNAEATRIRHMVIGIGINVLHAAFPPELDPIATSLLIETGLPWSRQEILILLLQSLHREISALTNPGTASAAQASILDRIENVSSWVRGKNVRIEEGEGYTGVTDGLDGRGFLRVRTSSGVRTVLSGGVREI
jgi:BirA family biotin operon repressor/biotin-[acetyl-CoA-carboxylase] ligase